MRILLVNLTRFGDLLQTQPVIHALGDAGHAVGLLCLENFASAGSLLDGVQALFPLPGAKFLALLDSDWRKSTALLYSFRKAVMQKFPPDCVFNLTASANARLLARLFAGTHPVHGLSVDDQGFSANGTLWANFFEASSRKRGCSPFNLADDFRKTAGVAEIPARFALRRPAPAMLQKFSRMLAEHAAGSTGYVAFQLGASQDRRRWPVSYFAELGRHIHTECSMMPILLGEKNETSLAHEYLSSGAPGIDLTGRTSLAELAAVLVLCRLLVTNDTGTMHLAAGLGVHSLAIFLATAQPCDTGPYLENCCCLEPAMACHPCGFEKTCTEKTACREFLRADAVWSLVQPMLHTGQWSESVPAETAKCARVWLTVRDSDGFMDLRSLSGHEKEERSIWMRLQRHFYRQFLDMADSQKKNTEFASLTSSDAELVHYLPAERRQELQHEFESICAFCDLLEQQGKALLNHVPNTGRQFLGTIQRITTFLETADRRNAFDALGRLWTVATQERGENLHAVLDFARLFAGMMHAWSQSLNI